MAKKLNVKFKKKSVQRLKKRNPSALSRQAHPPNPPTGCG